MLWGKSLYKASHFSIWKTGIFRAQNIVFQYIACYLSVYPLLRFIWIRFPVWNVGPFTEVWMNTSWRRNSDSATKFPSTLITWFSDGWILSLVPPFPKVIYKSMYESKDSCNKRASHSDDEWIKYCLFWHGQSFLFGAPATNHLWAAPMWCTVGKWRDKCFPVPIFHLGQCPKSSISLLWGVAHFPSPQNQGQGHGHGNDTGAIQDHGADAGFCIAASSRFTFPSTRLRFTYCSLAAHLPN